MVTVYIQVVNCVNNISQNAAISEFVACGFEVQNALKHLGIDRPIFEYKDKKFAIGYNANTQIYFTAIITNMRIPNILDKYDSFLAECYEADDERERV